MKNILLIIQREYLSRVKKKSFIIMTLLGPVLMVLLYGGIIWAGMTSGEQKKIEIRDESGLFTDRFKSDKNYIYEFSTLAIDSLKENFQNLNVDALVYIPEKIMEDPKSVKIYSKSGVSFEVQNTIEGNIAREIENIKLTEAGISRSTIDSAKIRVSAETISLDGSGEKKNSAIAATLIGTIAGFLIYMAVFIYGAQVMRSITEEKTSRIVEVLISSVKPFQLMIGKIVGVALVGLTQFGLWIIFSVILGVAGTQIFADKLQTASSQYVETQMAQLPEEASEAINTAAGAGQAEIYAQIIDAANTLPIGTILVCFIIYFLGGYLLYSSLFGAIGSAVDSETDTQQFMLPITIPIILAFVFAQFVIKDPHSSLAVWTSMIPFTSPIIMMVRIPFGVPVWQLVLSITLLIGGFVFTTWLAARIYRVGILMYGKKVSWKELGKWLFYRG